MSYYNTTFLISNYLLFINFSFTLGNFTKCCPYNQVLNSTFNGCISAYNITEITISNNNLNSNSYNVSLSNKINLSCFLKRKVKVLMNEEFDIFENTTLIPKFAIDVENFNSSEYCLDDAVNVEGKVALTCPCLRGTCLHVCCDPGHVIVQINETQSFECEEVKGELSAWNHKLHTSPYGEHKYSIIYNVPPSCPKHASLIVVNQKINETGHLSDPLTNVTILGNGSFYISMENDSFELSPSTYCIGLLKHGNDNVDLVEFACGHAESEEEIREQKIHTAIYATLFILGALFLLATLIVHILLSELRSTARGLSLMLHCAFMFVAYIALAIVQLSGHSLDDISCYVLAYTIQFSLLAGFFWMNIMCINISMTFRSLQRLVVDVNSLPRDDEEFKKFFYYGIYAMSVPIIITAITIWTNNNDVVPENIQPKIGQSYCWFVKEEGNYGLLLYFYGPMGFLLLINLVLFVFTVIKILSYSRQTAILNRHNSQRHARIDPRDNRLLLFLKLFGLMGIPWIMEIISWIVGGNASYWYVTDAINLLRSAYIFYMFCCTPEVLQSLKRKYPRCLNTLQEIPQNSVSHISKHFRKIAPTSQQHQMENF